MKFKIDENLPTEIGADLRALGNDADTVLDESLQGESDPVIVARARAEGRVLLTLDKGIANVVHYPKQLHSGIVLFRPGS